jgi:hypothetical protein
MADRPYGLLAEFDSPEALKAAAQKAREAGYSELDAFTPFPVEGLPEILRLPAPTIGRIGLIGGFAGAAIALVVQCYVNYDYPINVGGRPSYAFSAFAVVTFEFTILVSALSMIVAMLWQNGLPRLSYPLFAARRIHLASKDRFFLCIKGEDAAFDETSSAAFLKDAGARSVELVPP